MKLTTKTVSVGTNKINAKVTKEQIDDLNNLYKSFRYKIENQSEKLVLESYFRIKFAKDDYVNYCIPTKQEIRKLKLLILKNDELAKILQKILDNSEFVEDPSIQDIESILVNELSQQINLSIISKLRSLSNGQK